MNLTQELVLEFGRLGIVYVHLIACCVAIGLVLKSDVAMVKDMLKGDRASELAHMKQMKGLQSTVAIALVALWATGAAIVTLDALSKGGWQYFANPKLQAKILIVVLLTLNGVVLHNLVLPWLQKAGSMMNLTFDKTVLATFAGTVSGVSWLYAAMLGVGRPLAWKYSLGQLLAAYPLMIAGGFISMMALILWCRQRTNPSARSEAATFARVSAGS
ncbi:MAG: hypothetical protein ABWZ88_17750 [Variovorax sp.]